MSSSSGPTRTCLACGGRDPKVLAFGPVAQIAESEYSRLRALFLRELDAYRCALCKQPTGYRPTIVVELLDGGERLVCLGEMALEAPEPERQKLLKSISVYAESMRYFDSLDELRAAAAKRVVALVNNVQSVFGSDDLVLKGDGWRRFTSNHFAAAALLLTVPLPGVGVQLPKGASHDGIAKNFASVQVRVWLKLCASWTADLEAGRTLEGELNRYVDPNAMLHVAADEFIRVTEAADKWSAPGRFCLEAIRASLLAWRGKANPRLDFWAEQFVLNEATRRIAGGKAPAWVAPMEIDAERARLTIPYEALFDACARFLAKNGIESLEVIDELARKVGHADMAVALGNAIRPAKGSKKLSVIELIDALRKVQKDRSPGLILAAASNLLHLLAEEQTPPVIEGIAEGIQTLFGDDPDARARIEAWLASRVLRLNDPKAALSRIGAEPAPWEARATPHSRAHLDVERSNALRMAGRRREAIVAAERALKSLSPEDSGTVVRNLAILYREDGQQERALSMLLDLLPKATGEERVQLIHSLAVTYSLLGRQAEASPYLEEGARLAKGPFGGQRPTVLAALAVQLSLGADRKRALELLRDISDNVANDPMVLVPMVSAYLNLFQARDVLEDQDRERLKNLHSRLDEQREATFEAGNLRIHFDIVRLQTAAVELLRIGKTNVFAELLEVGTREFEGSPDPWALVIVARDKLAGGDYKMAMKKLREFPSAIAARFSAETDMSLKVDSLKNFSAPFGHIVGLLNRRPDSLRDIRFVAELQRDVFGRIAAAAIEDTAGGFVAPEDASIVTLGGPAAIMEWADSHDGLAGLITFVDRDGKVTVRNQPPVEGVDTHRLAARINQRLSTWHAGREGDPFDVPGWSNFERWLAEQLEESLPDGGRLIVIEHPEVAGLQWHVAAGARWLTSYAPSWSALLAKRSRDGERSPALGLAIVPRYGESEAVLSALESSAERTAKLAEQIGLHLLRRTHADCDRKALVDLLECSSVAKLLCHGFVQPKEHVVALMIANEGRLPLATSVAAGTAAGRAHRFDWRDCQKLRAAPSVMFSAACSSGQAHLVGLGDRLGLFSGLRRRGTHTVVAPRWDIVADAVLPILDDAIERWLRQSTTVGQALHAACVEASHHNPRWIAWALSMEGAES